MSYQLQVVSAAVQQIKKLTSQVQQQVMMELEKLVLNPFPEIAKQLEQDNSLYVIYLNEYRIVYEIQEDFSLIRVMKVSHPKDY